jgi:hypothetical protein
MDPAETVFALLNVELKTDQIVMWPGNFAEGPEA